MVEFFYPIHGIESMDIAIPILESTAGLSFKKTEAAILGSTVPRHSICCLANNSTCFLIAVSNGLVRVNGEEVIGFILTAVNCISSIITGELKKIKVSISFSVLKRIDEGLCAWPLLVQTDKNPVVDVSPSTGLSVLFIKTSVEPNSAFCPIEIDANKIIHLNDVVLTGHPMCPADFDHIFSGFTEEKILMETFSNFDKLVTSQGTIKEKTELLLEVECSSTSGMSGCPCFEKRNSISVPAYLGYTFARVYLNGPPIKGQYELVEDLRAAVTVRDRTKLLNELERIYSESVNIKMKDLLRMFIVCIQVASGDFNESELVFFSTMCSNVLQASVSGDENIKNCNRSYLFKTVMPNTHLGFDIIRRCKNSFINFAGRNVEFSTLSKLISFLGL